MNNSDNCPRFGWRAGEIEIGRPPAIDEVMRGFDQPKIVIVGGRAHGTDCGGVLDTGYDLTTARVVDGLADLPADLPLESCIPAERVHVRMESAELDHDAYVVDRPTPDTVRVRAVGDGFELVVPADDVTAMEETE